MLKQKKATAELKRKVIHEDAVDPEQPTKTQTKKTGKGKKGCQADAAPSPALTAPILSKVLDDNATATRKKVWLDDVLCAITNVLD